MVRNRTLTNITNIHINKEYKMYILPKWIYDIYKL